MKRKSVNSFDKALAAANKRLGMAIAERTEAQERLSALNGEIPALQRTIAALEAQIEPGKGVVPIGNTATPAVSGAASAQTRADIPAGIFLPPEDLSNFGSIPAKSGQPARELTEDELLEDVGGQPLAGE